MKKKIGIAAASAGILFGGIAVYMSTGTDSPEMVEPAASCEFRLVPLQEVGLAETNSSGGLQSVCAVETASSGVFSIPEVVPVETVSSPEVVQPGMSPVSEVRESQGPEIPSLEQVEISEEDEIPVWNLAEIEVGEIPSGFGLSEMFQVDLDGTADFGMASLGTVDLLFGPEFVSVLFEPVSIVTNAPISRWALLKGIGTYGSRAWALAKEGERQEAAGNKELADKLYMRLLILSERID